MFPSFLSLPLCTISVRRAAARKEERSGSRLATCVRDFSFEASEAPTHLTCKCSDAAGPQICLLRKYAVTYSAQHGDLLSTNAVRLQGVCDLLDLEVSVRNGLNENQSIKKILVSTL